MRWTCPHCHTELSVPESKLSQGWTFTRCYKCREYSLIRKNDQNVIKVDGAGTVERFDRAVTHFEKAQDRRLKIEELTRELRDEIGKVKSGKEVLTQKRIQELDLPLRPSGLHRSKKPEKKSPYESHSTETERVFPDPLPEEPKKKKILRLGPISAKILALVGISSVFAGLSTYFLVRELISTFAPAKETKTQTQETNKKEIAVTADRVSVRSNAVVREPKLQEQVKSPAAEQIVENSKKSQIAEPVTQSVKKVVKKSWFGKAKVQNVIVRSGPGTHYPKLGYASTDWYVVEGTKKDWTKIILKVPGPAGKNDELGAWVRSDLLDLKKE